MVTTTWDQKAGMTSPTDTDNLESFADQAKASKDAAAASEAAAAASAAAAAASEVEAESAEANAATSATTAASGAATATTKASEAAASATSASTSASEAQTAQTAAEAAETAAAASETASAASAAAASTSETNAATSASAASTSETNAATSATSAATSATASASSATASAASASAASASETAAAASETAAAASETAAATSEGNAATSASNAATSATNAATSEANASTSATAAASSASSASASADAALAALDSFDDRYLGQKASDPTLDNDGNALVAGALYFNTTDDVMKVYEGSVWVAAYASLSGALLAANNLSDVLDAAAARTNIGLGTAATTASTDYATAAQGALADSAVQPNDSPSFGSVTVSGTVDGRDVAADGSKLDGIETGATADQTAGEIKTAYESNANTNAYTDAEKSKLAGIASGAEVNTVDSVNTQTGAVVLDADDISDAATTNKFTTAAEISKLAGIEAGANVTDTANVTAAGALMDSEVTNLAQVKAFSSADYATAAQGSLADSALQSGDNVSALTNDAGYTTNVGDITGVTAGTGLTGGGTSGTVTLNGVTQSEATWEAGTGTTESLVTPAKVKAAIDALAGGGGGVPTGAVIYVAQNTAPTDFLKANGAAVSRTTYADLFAAIGTTFGSGDGSTTFNLPDLRGEFIRAWDDARGIDSGRSFGSSQADEFKLHGHPSRRATQAGISNDTSGGGIMIDSNGAQANVSAYTGTPANVYGRHIGGSGGSETRPRNIALLACIKY